jgi:hypothetical protein
MKKIMIATVFSVLGAMAASAAELAPKYANAPPLVVKPAGNIGVVRGRDDIDSTIPPSRRAIHKAAVLSGLLFVAIGAAFLASPSGEGSEPKTLTGHIRFARLQHRKRTCRKDCGHSLNS